jgi:septal ring factor EnvC (AmiA/AmiB activator)
MNCHRTTTQLSRRFTKLATKQITMMKSSCLLLSSLMTTAAWAVPDTESHLETARATVAKWVETQQLIYKEKRDWQQGRELLLGRIELIKNEISSLEEKIKAAGDTATDTDGKKAELMAQNEALKQVGRALAADLAALEQDVRAFRAVLPEAMLAKLHPLYQRIPEDPNHTKASLAERYQNVLGILNEITKFNSEITLVSEIRTLANGKPAEVKTVYVGLGQAYFLSAKGEAGIGRPTAAGWQWESVSGIAPRVLAVIEILQNKSHPAFVPLPVKLQ